MPVRISIMGKPIWLIPMGISIMDKSNYCNLSDKTLYYPAAHFSTPLLPRCYSAAIQGNFKQGQIFRSPIS